MGGRMNLRTIHYRQGLPNTMQTRTAVVATIALITTLMAVIGLAVVAAWLAGGEIPERVGSIVTSILGAFATVCAGLLLFLRMDTGIGTVDKKVDDAAVIAAAARAEARRAAHAASIAARKTEEVHNDLLNGGLRENVKKAVRELEDDPEFKEQRIETTARGVQKDRHDKANREAGPHARAQMEERVRQRRVEEFRPPLDDSPI